jgi:hypothetical protein
VSDVDVQLCDQRSVGLLVVRDGSLLLRAPSAYPGGYAPVHRHCDGLTFPETARALATQLGLAEPTVRGADESWRPDVCTRPQHETAERTGHWWLVYWAVGQGEPQGEGLRWWTRKELQDLADRTVAYARGALRDGAWRAQPGVSALWVGWLAHLRLIGPVPSRDLRACADVASRPIGGWL